MDLRGLIRLIDYIITMSSTSYWNALCSDCKRVKCHKGCNCDCHWNP